MGNKIGGKMVKKKTYKGLQEHIRTMKTPKIDVFKNKYNDKDYIINVQTSEFTCVCPKTGLPDYAEINLEYTPDKNCLELKSFKEYLCSYRDIGIFHEHFTNRLLDDIVKDCAPRWVKVKTLFNARGGIKTTVEAEYRK